MPVSGILELQRSEAWGEGAVLLFFAVCDLATVAPGIAEALIATAVGLFAAIPAVVAYNFFIQRVRVVTKDMENFSTDLINTIERHLRKSS